MNKFFKFLSATLAGCMMMTMFAGAANLNAVEDEPETETLTGTAAIVTADGVIYKDFEYTLPADADDEEVEDIIMKSSAEAVGVASVGRATTMQETVARDSDFWIPADSSNSIRCSRLPGNGGLLQVGLSRVTNTRKVTIAIGNGAAQYNVDVSSGGVAVLFYHGDIYSGVECELNAGSRPVLYFNGDRECTSCKLTVIQHY